jgi:hypothetical protein
MKDMPRAGKFLVKNDGGAAERRPQGRRPLNQKIQSRGLLLHKNT